MAENESSICLRSIQHLATVFIFKVIGADIENVFVTIAKQAVRYQNINLYLTQEQSYNLLC